MQINRFIILYSLLRAERRMYTEKNAIQFKNRIHYKYYALRLTVTQASLTYLGLFRRLMRVYYLYIK